jgi:purine-binding chemotaxis protein CheW
MNDTKKVEPQSLPDEGENTASQFLTFDLNDENYGIGILHIREIIEYGNVTPVPLMPSYIAGVINLRGAVVPVVNLARRFEMEPKPVNKKTSIVIIELSEQHDSVEIGIIVDMVNEVIDLNDSDITAAPSFGTKIRSDFIKGMGKINDKLMILLDVDHVLSIEELSEVQSLTESVTDG